MISLIRDQRRRGAESTRAPRYLQRVASACSTWNRYLRTRGSVSQQLVVSVSSVMYIFSDILAIYYNTRPHILSWDTIDVRSSRENQFGKKSVMSLIWFRQDLSKSLHFGPPFSGFCSTKICLSHLKDKSDQELMCTTIK